MTSYTAAAARLTDPWSNQPADYWLAGVWDEDGKLIWSSEPQSYDSEAEALADARRQIEELEYAASTVPRQRGAAIAAIRKQLGISQDGLARLLEVDQSAISRWEREGAPLLALLAAQAIIRRAAKPRVRRKAAAQD